MAASGQQSGHAVVLVGQDRASEAYVRSKAKLTTEVGMASFKHVSLGGLAAGFAGC